jgi:hypothetical protein
VEVLNADVGDCHSTSTVEVLNADVDGCHSTYKLSIHTSWLDGKRSFSANHLWPRMNKGNGYYLFGINGL